MKPTALRSLVMAPLVVAWLSFAGVAGAGNGDCSQPVSSGASPNATDCLYILRVVVGLLTCAPEPCVCAPKGTLPASATDALLCLRTATGQPLPLNCPCSNPCDQGSPPQCGGTCEDAGDECGQDPFEPSTCTCLDACERSAAPACGASCAGSEIPGAVCIPVSITPEGQPTTQVCSCLPTDLVACSEADTPDCAGLCAAGSLCKRDGGACACEAQPVQGACAGASAPACAGVCSEGTICEDSGGTCACVAHQGQPESCFEAGVPSCGGSCASGNLCAIEVFGTCECLAPCEISAAPACGGTCPDDGACIAITATAGSLSLEFCECQ
jgi:hypothetical protein